MEIGKIINKIGENQNFHIVSIYTASASTLSKLYIRIIIKLYVN